MADSAAQEKVTVDKDLESYKYINSLEDVFTKNSGPNQLSKGMEKKIVHYLENEGNFGYYIPSYSDAYLVMYNERLKWNRYDIHKFEKGELSLSEAFMDYFSEKIAMKGK